MSESRLFNDGWEFAKQAFDGPDFPLDEAPPAGLAWAPTAIPHDWLIGDAEDLYRNSVGWYRKSLDQPSAPQGPVLLRFEGAYMDSGLFVNGRKAGEWKNGYTSFEFDIAPYLVPGRNELSVRVVYRSPNSRWYSGAGIYRNVRLKRLPASHLASDGVYVSTAKNGEGWRVIAGAEAVIAPGARGPFALRRRILDAEGRQVACAEAPVASAAGLAAQEASIDLRDPRLWDIEDPALYCLETTLLEDGREADRSLVAFGFRTIEFHPERGFLLNGRRLEIQGVCQHHDLGCLGSAVNKAALRRQLALLKEMGANAIRTSHNPPAAELMDLADEMGILIESEIYDMWERPKTEYDFARFFADWSERDVASWIRRDRNHPSVIMWSLGNEIHDCHAGPRGLDLTKRLLGLVLRHDPRGNARPTLSSNYMPWEGAQNCADEVKLAGYNYGTQCYARHHLDHPDWIIYGSETASIVQSRGVYHFPLSRSILDDEDLQCSSLGNSSVSWGAKDFESGIIEHRDAGFCLGQFIWTGTDYIGEPTPYRTKNSYFGQIDTAGFPKDAFYCYQAEWTDFRKQPMVHVFPYWDFNEGQRIDLRVCSNAPAVELFLDGESLGRKELDHSGGKKLIAEYQADYRPGELRAVAYDASGRPVAEERRSSFGDAAAVRLAADKAEILADGRDLAFIEIGAEDAAGRAVENANSRVEVEVSGPGRLVGLDNGDSADYDQYKGTSRRLFSGKLLAVVAAGPGSGELRIEVSSRGLRPASLVLKALAAALPEGAAAMEGVPRSRTIEDVPVRKIEITSASGRALTKDKPSSAVRARLHPADASYRDIEWRVTDDAGIDSSIARVEARGDQAVVTSIADGRFRLRCASRNGADGPRLVSQLDFTASGLGAAFLDPYGFVAGALYGASNAVMGNGNEQGVATLRDGESHVGFRNVDFGGFGIRQ